MPTLYIVRHGQTDWNLVRRLQGIIEVPINALGRSQALRNGAVLNDVITDKSAIDFVCSPLIRARETMELVCTAMGVDACRYRTDSRLQEMSFGTLGGRIYPEWTVNEPEAFAARENDPWNWTPEQGESYRDLSLRVVDWLAQVRQDTICVTHGGVMRVLRGHLFNLLPCEVVRLSVPQDKVLLIDGKTLTWL